MYIIIEILAGIIILQSIIMWKYQRQVKDICRQLAFLMKHDSNMLIHREFGLGGIGMLSDRLNDLQERETVLSGERNSDCWYLYESFSWYPDTTDISGRLFPAYGSMWKCRRAETLSEYYSWKNTQSEWNAGRTFHVHKVKKWILSSGTDILLYQPDFERNCFFVLWWLGEKGDPAGHSDYGRTVVYRWK